MPQCNYVIKDTVTGMYLKVYSTDLPSCQWGNPEDAICFETKQQAAATIAAWQGATPGRFIGTNPPPR